MTPEVYERLPAGHKAQNQGIESRIQENVANAKAAGDNVPLGCDITGNGA